MDLGEFNASDLVGPVRLVTGSRDIKIEKFTRIAASWRRTAATSSCSRSLPLPSIDARSGVGRIDLILPDKATFDLQATAERGEAVNDFGPPIQQEMEGRTATLEGQSGRRAGIRLTADRGSVSVRREGSEPGNIPDSMTAPPKPPRPPKTPKSLGDSEIKM